MSSIVQQIPTSVTTPAAFGVVVARSRRDLNMTREQLAWNAEVSVGRLRKIERGEECTPEERQSLASALNRWLTVRGSRVATLLERAHAAA